MSKVEHISLQATKLQVEDNQGILFIRECMQKLSNLVNENLRKLYAKVIWTSEEN